MAAIQELFAPLYAYVLSFKHTDGRSAEAPSYDQVVQDLGALLAAQEQAAQQADLGEAYEEARFAFLTWADEVIQRECQAWSGHQKWTAEPLQKRYLRMTNAGDIVSQTLETIGRLGTTSATAASPLPSRNLAKLPDGPRQDVYAIYYFMLGLGFTGRYFRPTDAATLTALRHNVAQNLRPSVTPLREMSTFFGRQPYHAEAPPPLQIRLAWRLLGGAGLIAALVLLSGLALAWLLRSTPPTLAESIKDHLECAAVTTVQRDGLLILEGRVMSQERKDNILAIVKKREGVERVRDAMTVIPKPFCQALEVVEPFKKRTEEQAVGLNMQLPTIRSAVSPSMPWPSFKKKDPLQIRVNAPTAFPSYVYVDYYIADGHVGRLFTPSTPVGPQQVVDIKDFEIETPFGLELLVVMATKEPGKIPPLPMAPLSVAEYLPNLRQALQQIPPDKVAVTFRLIFTQEQ